MKHIKSLSEAIKNLEEYDEAVEYCEEGLAYLVDRGFKLKFNNLSKSYPSTGIAVEITEIDDGYFNWLDVKDDIMSFLIKMNSEYFLTKTIRNGSFTIQTLYHTKKDIENPNGFTWSTMPVYNDRGRMFTIRQLDKTTLLNDVRMLEINFTIKNKRY